MSIEKDESMLVHHIPGTELVSKYPFLLVSSKHCENVKRENKINKYSILGMLKNKKTLSKNRVLKIKKYIDKLIVVFPFEVSWFKKYGLDVKFFGHPLIDQFRTVEKFDKHKQPNTVALFPGSRHQEIKKHLPLLNLVAKKLKKERPSLRFIMNISPSHSIEEVQSQLVSDIRVVQKNSSDVFMSCSAAVVTSGTATLECAITETPFIVIYKASLLSWLIAKFLLSVPFICIVNLLANKEIVPELVQGDASVLNICLLYTSPIPRDRG